MSTGRNLVTLLISDRGFSRPQRRHLKTISPGGVFAVSFLLACSAIDAPLMKNPPFG